MGKNSSGVQVVVWTKTAAQNSVCPGVLPSVCVGVCVCVREGERITSCHLQSLFAVVTSQVLHFPG